MARLSTEKLVLVHLNSIGRALPCLLVVVLTLLHAPNVWALPSCDSTQSEPGLASASATGWGIDLRNTRYQPQSSLAAANVDQLELAWVYGLSSNSPRSLPLVTHNAIFVGDGGRGLVALARDGSCEHWVFEHNGEIASAIVPGQIGTRSVLVFNDRNQGLFVVDASTGELVWQAVVEDEPIPWYSGTPLVTNSTVYLPVSSLEVALAANPLYGCCKSSGGLAAFDLATGKKLWYLPTIAEPAQKTGTHWGFVSEYGPSGAAVWGAPSYDEQRQWLFIGTGQNYSHPTTKTSDALIAVDAATGEIQWVNQFTENDAYTAACNIEALNHPNCPDPVGPDVDFGAPTMLLRDANGREVLVGGQKSAEVHGVDPQTGENLWTRRLGRGGIIGGVHWGMAANESLGLVYVPISDKALIGFPSPGEPAPGLYAVDITTGDLRWTYSRESRCPEQACVYGLSAAITAANDIVVTGSMDGYLEVFAAATGERVWSYDAWQDYEAINNIATTGGAFDAHGAVLVDDLLIVSAGYGYVGNQRAGNALLVFKVNNDE